MEYLSQILRFNDSLPTNNLSPGQIALWYALMHVNNKCSWTEWFKAANRTLELYTGLSKNGVIKARNVLKQKGLIDFKSNGTSAASFKLKILYGGIDSSTDSGIDSGIDSSTDSGTDSGTKSSPLNRLRIRQDKDKDKDNKKEKDKKETAPDEPNVRKKERKAGSYDEILSVIEDEELKNLYYEFIKMRKLIKAPMTDRALITLIDKMNKLEPVSIERRKQLLENSIVNNWKSVYPLKDDETDVKADGRKTFDNQNNQNIKKPQKSRFNNYDDGNWNRAEMEALEERLLDRMLEEAE